MKNIENHWYREKNDLGAEIQIKPDHFYFVRMIPWKGVLNLLVKLK